MVDCRLLLRDIVRLLLLPFWIAQLVIIVCLGLVSSALCGPYCLIRGWMRPTPKSDDYGFEFDQPASVNVRDVGYSNMYLTMKDGTRIAVDVWLPKGVSSSSGDRVGCVLHQSRYFRSFHLWCPASWLRGGRPVNLINFEFIDAFLARGLAVVSMDIRGSGASFGRNKGPWLPVETEDSIEVIEWIIRQPWSNGKVGTWGISYEGTAGLLTTASGHNAVAACCPMYVFLDVFRDIGYPGGIHLHAFAKNWRKITEALDNNSFERLFPCALFSLDGCQPVGGSKGWKDLRAAVVEHKNNWNPVSDATVMEYTDDISPISGFCADDASPYIRIDRWISRLQATHHRAQTPTRTPTHNGHAGDGNGAAGVRAPEEVLLRQQQDTVDGVERAVSMEDVDITDGGLQQQGQQENGRRAVVNGANAHAARMPPSSSVGGGTVAGVQGTAGSGEQMQRPAFLLISGWFDSTASCALKLWRQLHELTDVRLVVGAWNHSGIQHGRFFPGAQGTGFKKFKTALEIAAWMVVVLGSSADEQRKDEGLETDGLGDSGQALTRAGVSRGGHGDSASGDVEAPAAPPAPPGELPPPVRYFTMQEEVWKSASAFPTPTTQRLFLQCPSSRTAPASTSFRQSRDRCFCPRNDPAPPRGSLVSLHSSASANPLPASPITPRPQHEHPQHQASSPLHRRHTDEEGWGGEVGASCASAGEGHRSQSLDVHIYKSRASYGVSRYLAMTHVFLPMKYNMDHSRVQHLRFRTGPLTKPVEVTGFPLVRLWVSSSTVDASVFVYLLCVDQHQKSHYITEGALRVSSRKTAEAGTYDGVNMYPTLPIHTFHREDAQFLSSDGSPVEVSIAMHPVSYMFKPGQRICVAVGGADPVDYLPLRLPNGQQTYTLTVHTGPRFSSSVDLPVVGGGLVDGLGVMEGSGEV